MVGRCGNPAGVIENQILTAGSTGGRKKRRNGKMSTRQTKINPVVRLIATIIFGLLVTTIAVVIGVTILGVGKAHAGTQATATYAVVYAQRGGHGHGGRA
jgi:hypothetical protein